MSTTESTSSDYPELGQHSGEPHGGSLANRMNWLRAGVLGANDGIVSVAGIVMAFAGATTDGQLILIAGIAGLVAGALSMAAGEYVSVSAQRDSERALIAKETRELAEDPEEELAELAELYHQRGLSPDLARQVAIELTAKDALAAHLEVELGIDQDDLNNPWQAAAASMVAFTVGAILPIATMSLFTPGIRSVATIVAVTVALACTGWISARVGGAKPLPAVARIVVWGLVSMGVGYAVGSLAGVGIA